MEGTLRPLTAWVIATIWRMRYDSERAWNPICDIFEGRHLERFYTVAAALPLNVAGDFLWVDPFWRRSKHA
jgi:hypothetical protein